MSTSLERCYCVGVPKTTIHGNFINHRTNEQPPNVHATAVLDARKRSLATEIAREEKKEKKRREKNMYNGGKASLTYAWTQHREVNLLVPRDRELVLPPPVRRRRRRRFRRRPRPVRVRERVRDRG